MPNFVVLVDKISNKVCQTGIVSLWLMNNLNATRTLGLEHNIVQFTARLQQPVNFVSHCTIVWCGVVGWARYEQWLRVLLHKAQVPSSKDVDMVIRALCTESLSISMGPLFCLLNTSRRDYTKAKLYTLSVNVHETSNIQCHHLCGFT